MNALITSVDVIKAHAIHGPRAAERRSCRVLVVDDDPSMLQFVNCALVAAGYDTTLASDGPDALMTAETHGPFDVLLTDVMMRQMRARNSPASCGRGIPQQKSCTSPATPTSCSKNNTACGRTKLSEQTLHA